MGGKCPHRKVKKRRYSHKTNRRSKFEVMGDDLVYDSLKKINSVECKKLPIDEDLPGMGQFYCLHCDRYFANVTVRDEHFKTKRHKKRNTRPRITKQVLFQIFLCSLFGLEAVGIRTRGGRAKIVGTIVCVGGAMLLSFYHGDKIDISPPKFRWTFSAHTVDNHVGSNTHHNLILGPLCIFVSNIAMAIWFILQAKMSESFQAPYTSSALLCFMASIQCGAVATINNYSISDWSLRSRIRLVSSLYAGLIGSALAFCLMSWTIQRKGPLYVSVFNPLLLVILALLSWALSMEKLYVGMAIVPVLIVLALYAVLWGKSKEVTTKSLKIDTNGALDQGGDCESEELEKQQQLVELKGVCCDQALTN